MMLVDQARSPSPKRLRPNPRAFTLLEALTVIAILGILTAVLLPVLHRAKNHAYLATCQNHLHQMDLALQMYVNEHRSTYPYYLGPPDPWDDSTAGHANRSYWWSKLHPYYPVEWTDNKYHCPGYKGAITAGVGGNEGPYGSYAYNTQGVRPIGGGYRNPKRGIAIDLPDYHFGLGTTLYRSPNMGYDDPITSESDIKVPSKMISIGASRFDKQKSYGPGGRGELECGFIKYGADFNPFNPARHGDHYNVLFCDGHIEAMDPWVLFDPTKSAKLWNYDHKPHAELWVP